MLEAKEDDKAECAVRGGGQISWLAGLADGRKLSPKRLVTSNLFSLGTFKCDCFLF